MTTLIILGSLFAYTVVGIWSYRAFEARRMGNPKACHYCHVCVYRAAGAILWPLPASVLVPVMGVLGTANLPRRLSAWRRAQRAAKQERLAAKIIIPPRAVVGLEDYRKLMPLVRRYEERLPIHERE